MVAAFRYWYKALGLNKEAETGWIADYLFKKETGKDSYMEDLGTLWLLHFLASEYKLYLPTTEQLVKEIDGIRECQISVGRIKQ